MEAPAEVMEAPAEKANTAKGRKIKKNENTEERRKRKGIPFVGPSIEGPTRVGPSI